MFEEALALVIVAVRPEQTGTAPDIGRRWRNVVMRGDFVHGEQATRLQSRVATF